MSHPNSPSKATRKKRKPKRPRPLLTRKKSTGVVTRKYARQIAAALAYSSLVKDGLGGAINRIAGLSKADCVLVEEAVEALLARLWKRAGTYTLEWRK